MNVRKMDRRAFFKITCATFSLGAMSLWAVPEFECHGKDFQKCNHGPLPDQAVKDRLVKTRLFDQHFKDDLFLSSAQMGLLHSCLVRMKRIQRVMGYGHFCLAGFDDALAYAGSYARIGKFTTQEIQFLEDLFYTPAGAYGFMGEKPIQKITMKINRKKSVKIPGTGHYLYRGKPVQMYKDIQKKIGPEAVLTSGIRGVMKQFLLFLNKTASSRGNLSMASRSLAPPGYSFHGTGDFDVGEKGFGVDNFTEKFIQTRVYNQLSDLGYIKFRYDRENDLGVRFEPWHVEVG
ncbi:MAG: D-alanyl-D-alanine carboxypeptidase family protein [Desulfobacter sp.]|nr:MAG: D-alanyl-D-alanine carboxypeptidase family protein [Desulfobacter sp.]